MTWEGDHGVLLPALMAKGPGECCGEAGPSALLTGRASRVGTCLAWSGAAIVSLPFA